MLTRCKNQQNRNDHFCSLCKRRMANGECYWRDATAEIICDGCQDKQTAAPNARRTRSAPTTRPCSAADTPGPRPAGLYPEE
jgi:hypothetical protein